MFDADCRALVIAPHVDDAEFGLGGTLSRFKGVMPTAVAIMAFGPYIRSDGRDVDWSTRTQEARDALGYLGVQDVRFLKTFLENRGLIADFGSMVKQIETLVKAIDPTDVFVSLPSSNQDHEAVHRATITAFRPGNLPGVKRLFAYEYAGNGWGPQRPDAGRCYVSLSAVDRANKIAALSHHQSQHIGRAWTELKGVGPLLELRGVESGTDFAECLWLLRGKI